jgi:hypothetical protein
MFSQVTGMIVVSVVRSYGGSDHAGRDARIVVACMFECCRWRVLWLPSLVMSLRVIAVVAATLCHQHRCGYGWHGGWQPQSS